MGLQPPHERQNRAFVGTPVKGPCFHPRAEARLFSLLLRKLDGGASREEAQRSRFLGRLKAHLGMTMWWGSLFWQLTTGCRQLLLTVEQGSNQGATHGPSDLKGI